MDLLSGFGKAADWHQHKGDAVMALPIAIFRLRPLAITAPPADAFEQAMGFSLRERFVGLYYQKRTLFLEDGVNTVAGDWRPWSIWHRSLGVDIHKHYCFGYEGRDPDHMLILDGHSRVLRAGNMQEAHGALQLQVPRAMKVANEESTMGVTTWRGGDADLLLASSLSVADSELHQAKKIEGMKKLKMWLRHRTRE